MTRIVYFLSPPVLIVLILTIIITETTNSFSSSFQLLPSFWCKTPNSISLSSSLQYHWNNKPLVVVVNLSSNLNNNNNDDDDDTTSGPDASSLTTTSRRKKRTRRKVDSDANPTTTMDSKSILPMQQQQQQEQERSKIEMQQQTLKGDELLDDIQQQQLKPRKESRLVAMKITDVRDLVGMSNQERTESSSSSRRSSMGPLDRMNKVFAKKEEETSSTPTKLTSTAMLDTNEYDKMDPIQRLLADAKEMEAIENKKRNNKDNNNNNDSLVDRKQDDENNRSIGSNIRNVISTIVTVDFFVVCGFLLWFLAGIFQSYVLKDDTIQIAFNSNFQLLVQPALGILMIAAITDAIFKKGDEEEN